MAPRVIKKATEATVSSYPTLKEHLASRRRFLEVAGASLAAGGLWAACSRGLGHSDGNTGTDASTPEPDADITMMGVMEEPQYYLLRVPQTGDLSAYLADGGYCSFYVEIATYSSASYDTLRYNMDLGGDAARAVLADYTYDGLNTAQGVAGAQDDLLDAYDALVQDLENHTLLTIEAVTLTISYLEPEGQIDGGIGMPDYP